MRIPVVHYQEERGVSCVHQRHDERLYPGFKNVTAPDQSGQINGCFRWKNIEDTAQRFVMELRLINKDELKKPVEMPLKSVVDVTLRRLQKFPIRKGSVYGWSIRVAEKVLQFGTVTVGEDGVLTMPAVTVSVVPTRLEVLPKVK